MHSALVRLQNVFGFFTTVAFTVATVIALSSFISPQSPSARIQLRNVQVVKGRPHYYSYKKEEYAHIRFDLEADLTSLFNWNTKQVFVYIKAVYPSLTPTHPPSEAIIWDAILASRTAPWHTNHYTHPDPKSKSGKKSVLPKKSKKALAASKSKPNPDDALIYPRGTLKLPNQRPKYQITDISGKMQGRENVTLEIGWNVQPWVGAQMWTTWEKVGAWEGLRGGRSAGFGFPAIAQGVKKGGLETEKGAEGFRLEVGQNAPGGKGKA